MSTASDFELIAIASRDQAYPAPPSEQVEYAIGLIDRMRRHSEDIADALASEAQTNRQSGQVRSIAAESTTVSEILAKLKDVETDLRSKSIDPSHRLGHREYRREIRDRLFELKREMDQYYVSLSKGEIRGLSLVSALRYLQLI